MAIIVRGKTKCGLCGRVISETDEITSFSPFVLNQTDELSKFSDAAFHSKCFCADPLSTECLAVYEESRSRLAPGCRECAICGNEIDHPDEYFAMAYLTRNPESILYRFNFYQAHRTCLRDSEDAVQLHEAIWTAHEQGELTGPGVEKQLQQLESLLPSNQPG